jgi:hypothetical protein
MAQSYGNAFCNLSATASRNANEGLFRNRLQVLAKPCEISINIKSGARSSRDRYVASDPQMWIRDVVEGPLNKRAWALQERLLSRRQLHFGARQIYWECQTLCASESSPAGIPSKTHGRKTLTKHFYFDTFNKVQHLRAIRPMKVQYQDYGEYLMAERKWLPTFKEQLSDLFNLWPRIVECYTRCDIRDWSKDRLIAISGIASSLYQEMPPEDRGYFSGVFKHDLTAGLLWASGGPATQPRNTHVPPWSWGSLNTFILYRFSTGFIFPGEKRKKLTKIRSTAQVCVNTYTGFHIARKSFLVVIRGKALTVSIKRLDKSDGGYITMTISGKRQYGNIWLDEDDHSLKQQSTSICWLPCLNACCTDGRYYTCGILMARVQDAKSPYTYRRIGLAIVAKIDRPYGRDDDVLCRALAKAREGWIRLE